MSYKLIQSFEAKELKKRSFAVKFADRLTGFFGSMWFLVINIVVFISWMLINSGKVPGVPIFDPYPFVLMITAVSLEAIVLTTVVLMSQNRQSLINSLREEIDMQVNLIAEREVTKVLSIVKKLAEKQGIEIDDPELAEMLKKTNLTYIERRLEEQLTEKPESFIKEVAEKVEEAAKPIVEVGERMEKTLEKTISPK